MTRDGDIAPAAGPAVIDIGRAAHDRRLQETSDRQPNIRRILRAVRHLHELVLGNDDPAQLIRQACGTLTTVLGYFQSWIVLLDETGTGIRDAAASGFGDDFDALDGRVRAGELPNCLSHALACRETVRIFDPDVSCRACCLATAYAGRAVLARSIRFKGTLFGAIVVSIPRELADDTEELTLFEELTRNLGFGLQGIRSMREAELQLQAAVEAGQIGLWDWDLVSERVWYSAEWKRQIGYDEHEIGDSSEEWSERLHPRDAPVAKQRVDEALHGRSPEFRTEFRFRHRDGSWRWILAHGRAMRDAEGRPVRILGSHVDITAHKQAQAEREHLLMAIEQAAESIVITDSNGSIHYVNPAFERITGYSREEVLGQTPCILRSGTQDDSFYEELWERIGRGEPWRGRFVNRRKDDSLYTVDSHISPVTDESGQIVSYVAVQRDITEELQLADERRRLEEQFRQSQKLESIGRLAGGVAHDLNNLLSPILGYSELLAGDLGKDDPRRGSALKVVEAAERARDLVRQLLTFSSKQLLEFQAVDLNAILHDFHPLLRRTIREDIAIELATASEPLWIEGDPGQLEQVVMNLAVNAQDAMPGGGTLAIEARGIEPSDDRLQGREDIGTGHVALLTVRDSGLGIDESTREHLFEPFFTTKARGQGTGLGLSTVYGIVKQHGGAIEVDSVLGEGSAFFVMLPMVDVDAPPKVEPAAEQEPHRDGGETILLAEDETSVRQLARDVLSRYGYHVVAAASGEQALEQLELLQRAPDLLLTDVIMPELDGLELSAKVKQRSPATRVLFMSGYTDSVALPAEVHRTPEGFLQKPFTVAQLTRQVRAALDRTERDDKTASPERDPAETSS